MKVQIGTEYCAMEIAEYGMTSVLPFSPTPIQINYAALSI